MRDRKRKMTAWLLVFVFLLGDPIVVHAYEWNERGQDYPFDQSDEEETVGTDGLRVYHITYELNGGRNSIRNAENYRGIDLPLRLEAARKPGYNFAGWYADSRFQKKMISIEEAAGDLVLYAKWTRKIDDMENISRYSYHTDAKLAGNTKTLKECSYQVLEYINIPGMPSTREADIRKQRILDEDQCPQGLCLTKDFILVTAYSCGWDVLGSLYLFDRISGEYLATLGMKKNSHLGGVAYDGTNVWICHSDNSTLERIPYQMLLNIAAEKPKTFVDCSKSVQAFHVKNRPSCVTCYNGELWVATENNLMKSKMISYRFDGRELKKTGTYTIPAKVQGVAFSSDGRVFLSTSLGRTKSSYLKGYASLEEMDKRPNKPAKKVEMPPCSEELAIYGGQVYVLFESAGQKYHEGTDGNGSSMAPLEKIICIRLKSI